METAAGARELAAGIEAANLELIQLVRGLSDEQWVETANDEGDVRSVGVIAHHVAHGHHFTMDWIDAALDGRPIEDTVESINEVNARHAETYHDVAREVTARLLERNGRLVVERVARLSDEELARTAYHAGAQREMTVAALVDLGRRHATRHLATIRKALGLD